MNTEPLRILATLITLALCACGGDGADRSSTNHKSQPAPAISTLVPSCAPAGVPLIDAADNLLTVIGSDFAAGSVVRWNGSDRPTASNGSIDALTAQIPAGDIAAAGTATVTVFNPAPGGGLSNAVSFRITVGAEDPQSIAVDPAGRFAYVMNRGCGAGTGGYVSMYAINPATGTLTSIAPPVPAYDYSGYPPGSVSVAPSGQFVFVTSSGDVWDADDGSVAIYALDATSGALTPAGSVAGNCPGLCLPAVLVSAPSGRFAYVATGDTGGFPDGVAMFSVDTATGMLTSIGAIAAGENPVSIAVHPSGKSVYAANSGSNDISIYQVDAATGALTAWDTVDAGKGPVSIAVDPSGRFAYVANSASGNVSMYSIDATGDLTSVGTISAGRDPVCVAADPSGRFLYVANSRSNDVSAYAINGTTGSLTLVGTAAAGLSPTSIAVHPSGKFVYVTNSVSNDVSMYRIGASGTLTLIGTVRT